MADDYSGHPKSIAEVRATKAHDAGLWTPRDALIAALRSLDSGEFVPTYLIVVSAKVEDDADKTTFTDYRSSIPSSFYGVGMLQAAISDFNRNRG